MVSTAAVKPAGDIAADWAADGLLIGTTPSGSTGITVRQALLAPSAGANQCDDLMLLALIARGGQGRSTG